MAPHLSARGPKRRVKKPDVDRRRRARIAVAVERLRTMLMEEGAAPPPPAPCTPPHLHHLSLSPRRGSWRRLQKVVVLELAVSHLRRLAAHHLGLQQYLEGYRRCQEEVLKFLVSITAVQPHAAVRLRQQLFPISVGADRQNAPSPADLHDVPAAGELRRSLDNGTDPSRLTLGDEQPQPRPVTSKTTVPQRPCGPDLAPPQHAPYSHMHWKKCLKPRAGTCFWRPW